MVFVFGALLLFVIETRGLLFTAFVLPFLLVEKVFGDGTSFEAGMTSGMEDGSVTAGGLDDDGGCKALKE